MRRVIVSEFLTLDGVMEGPGKDPVLDRGPEGDKFKFDELAAADALLLGRVTYKVFAVEALGELLFGASGGFTADPTPVKLRTVGGTEDGVAGQNSCKCRN